MPPVYLDYNATTPVDRRVAEAMLPYVREHFGNPSSSHRYGVEARRGVDKARSQVAEMLHARPREVVFTSGGSESINFAMKGVAWAYRERGRHIITSSVEHPAVIEVCRYLQRQGFEVSYLPVDEHGLVDLPMLQEAITPCTILISIMHANNEVGTIEPIAAITELARRSGILVHTDCAQSVGKIPVHVDDLGVDLLTVAGHKLHAPKGVGALYIREGVRLERLIHGAGQEMGWRAGTENVIHAVGLGEACAIVSENLPVYREHMREMRDRFEAALCRQLPDLRVNGHPVERLPNTSSISFKGLSATRLLDRLDRVAASAGAACHSDQIAVSHVLQAMQVPMDYALGTVRFSVGRATTGEEIDSAAAEVANAVRELRGGGQRSIW